MCIIKRNIYVALPIKSFFKDRWVDWNGCFIRQTPDYCRTFLSLTSSIVLLGPKFLFSSHIQLLKYEVGLYFLVILPVPVVALSSHFSFLNSTHMHEH